MLMPVVGGVGAHEELVLLLVASEPLALLKLLLILPGVAVLLRVGEGAGSRRGVSVVRGVVRYGGFESGEVGMGPSLVGEESGVWGFWDEAKGLVGEVVGVLARGVVVPVVMAEGDAGDSGRRKGEVRGELNERGEGL